MPFRRPRAEPRSETVKRLSGERDLRHQDQGLAAFADILGDAFEIDFGFARAGNPIDQSHGIAALAHRRAQRIGGGQLAEKEIGLGEIRIGRQRHFLRRQHDCLECAFVDQPVDDANTDACFPGRVAFGPGHAVGE